MEYSIKKQTESVLIILSGAFTFSDNATFRTLMQSVKESSSKSIIMDFAAVAFIDSAALGMLLLLREEQNNTKSITLRHSQGQVRKMFDMSKLEILFIVEK